MSIEISPTNERRNQFASMVTKPSIALRPNFKKVNNFLCGYLGLEYRNSGFIKIVWVALFGSKMIYFKSKSETIPLGSIDLSTCTVNVNPIVRSTHKSHSFEIYNPSDSEYYLFSTKGRFLKTRWLTAISSHQNINLDQKNWTERKPGDRSRSLILLSSSSRYKVLLRRSFGKEESGSEDNDSVGSEEDFRSLQYSESDGNIGDGSIIKQFLGKGSFPEFKENKRQPFQSITQSWARQTDSNHTRELSPVRSATPYPFDTEEEIEDWSRVSEGDEKGMQDKMMKITQQQEERRRRLNEYGDDKSRSSPSLLDRLVRPTANVAKGFMSPKRKASTARSAKEMQKKKQLPLDKGVSLSGVYKERPASPKNATCDLPKLSDEIKEKWEKPLDSKGSVWGDFPRIYRNVMVFSGGRRLVPGNTTGGEEAITRDDNTPAPSSPNIRKGLLGFIGKKKDGSPPNATIVGKSLSSLEMRDISVIRHYSLTNQQLFTRGSKSKKEKLSKKVTLEDLNDIGVCKIDSPFEEEGVLEEKDQADVEKAKTQRRNKHISQLLSLLATRTGEIEMAKQIEETFIKEVGEKLDLSRELRPYFEKLNPVLEEIKILRILKLMSQSIVAPPYMRLRNTFAAINLPVKDLAGFWSIEVHFEENGTISVCHSKRCASNSPDPTEQFNFMWRMEISLDKDLTQITNTTLEIFSLEFGPEMPQKSKVKVNKIKDHKLFM
eukprot:TRINITY_DN1764_c0_g1_i1.p1 TRINITY_DN1764_c0_g1~~TRINITY_DN1764_c0_g1_i1.p1  ORF type:complete len:719 (+),score=172.49 TRINITY_DN1764_c0_g1_i1:305-2461(+)